MLWTKLHLHPLSAGRHAHCARHPPSDNTARWHVSRSRCSTDVAGLPGAGRSAASAPRCFWGPTNATSPRHVFWGPVCAKKGSTFWFAPWSPWTLPPPRQCWWTRQRGMWAVRKKVPSMHDRRRAVRDPTLTKRGEGCNIPRKSNVKWNLFSHIPE